MKSGQSITIERQGGGDKERYFVTYRDTDGPVQTRLSSRSCKTLARALRVVRGADPVAGDDAMEFLGHCCDQFKEAVG